MPIGHPDFFQSVNPPAPQLIASGGPFAAGGGWSVGTFAVPSGGAYLIEINPTTFTASMAITDVQVEHLDASGQLVYVDYFAGLWAGGGPVGRNACSAAVCRGNLYGSQLNVVGVTAAGAFVNALMQGLVITTVGINVRVYTTPFTLTDPNPKVFPSVALAGALGVQTPAQLIASSNSVTVAHGTITQQVPLLPYAGPAVLTAEVTGITASTNGIIIVQGYTISGGSAAPVYVKSYRGWANGQYVAIPINIPACFATLQFQNLEAANNLVWTADITGGPAP